MPLSREDLEHGLRGHLRQLRWSGVPSRGTLLDVWQHHEMYREAESINELDAVAGWRRERSLRAWQAMQAWVLLCCIEQRGSNDTAFVMGLLVRESGL